MQCSPNVVFRNFFGVEDFVRSYRDTKPPPHPIITAVLQRDTSVTVISESFGYRRYFLFDPSYP